MKILFEIVIGIVLGLLFYFVYKYFKKEKLNKEILITSVLVFVFLTVCLLDVITIGNTTIGSIFEKQQYTEYYYVELYNESDVFMGKYPALIEADYIMKSVNNDKPYRCMNYAVNTIYYNDQELWCATPGIDIKEMKAGDKMTIYDSPIGCLYVKITTGKVNHETVDKL